MFVKNSAVYYKTVFLKVYIFVLSTKFNERLRSLNLTEYFSCIESRLTTASPLLDLYTTLLQACMLSQRLAERKINKAGLDNTT